MSPFESLRGVAVKPLTWEEDAHQWRWVAEVPLGDTYEVRPRRDGGYLVWRNSHQVLATADTLEQAKREAYRARQELFEERLEGVISTWAWLQREAGQGPQQAQREGEV